MCTGNCVCVTPAVCACMWKHAWSIKLSSGAMAMASPPTNEDGGFAASSLDCDMFVCFPFATSIKIRTRTHTRSQDWQDEERMVGRKEGRSLVPSSSCRWLPCKVHGLVACSKLQRRRQRRRLGWRALKINRSYKCILPLGKKGKTFLAPFVR